MDHLKRYMESSGDGLVARTIVVDVCKPADRQSGSKSRAVSLAPTKVLQQKWASQIKSIPATPVTGNVLIRPCNHIVDSLEASLAITHPHRKSISVPIVVPERFMRYVRSAVSRSHGPSDDEQSGVNFLLRTIGKRSDKADADSEEDEGSGSSDAECNDTEPPEPKDDDDAGETRAQQDRAFQQMTDPSLLSSSMLRQLLGKRSHDFHGVLFQHSARFAQAAAFLPNSGMFCWRRSETSTWRRYRKGQLDPSAFASALTSMLATSNMSLASNEVLVDMTGGTPEAIVAGIMVGFRKVLFVADGAERAMMTLPTQDEERDQNIDYNNFVPSPDGPANQGVLAAAAVVSLASYVANYVMDRDSDWKAFVMKSSSSPNPPMPCGLDGSTSCEWWHVISRGLPIPALN